MKSTPTRQRVMIILYVMAALFVALAIALGIAGVLFPDKLRPPPDTQQADSNDLRDVTGKIRACLPVAPA